MAFKLNPLTGEFDLVPDSGTHTQVLNPLTWEFNLTTKSQTYKQIFNPFSWTFNLTPWSKSITWNRYVDIFATSILGYKIYWNTTQWLTPTPEIPFEVKGVGDRTINLFDIANANIVMGAYIEANGSVSELANAVYTGAYIPVKPNTTYTWSGKDGGSTINYAICEYDADKTFIERHSRHTSLDDDTWTTNANTHFLRFNLKKSDTRTTLQLEEGSTATSYVPYGYQIPVKVNWKNLFDKSLYNNHGWYYSSGVIADSTANATVVIRAIPNKTYYIKHCSVAGGGRVMYTTEENWDAGSSCSWIIGNTSTTVEPNEVQSFTVPADAKWIFLLAGRQATASFQEQLDDYMLSEEELTTDTPYEPYYNATTPIYLSNPLYKLWDYKDILNSDWTITRNVGVKVLDWTEDWQLYTFQWYNTPYLIMNDMIETAAGTSSDNFKCTHFKYLSSVWTSDTIWFSVSTMKRMFFKRIYNDTVENFKAWLAAQYAAGTPVVVYYPLATPVTQTITAPEITLSWAGNYHIEIDTEVDATFDLTYI